MPSLETSTAGQVITFYSYKGGTGRSMAMANVACLLAQRQGQQVLMIDWDLEAPGLHRYFEDKFTRRFGNEGVNAFAEHPGLIELFLALNETTQGASFIEEEETSDLLDKVAPEQFILETDIPSLYFLKAGSFDGNYPARVNTFHWDDLYDRAPWLIRVLAERLAGQYDYVLIDSRTGLTDTSGICTMLMPEKLVVVFTPNQQSLTGVLGLIEQATDYRRQSDDLRPLVAFPLPSRIEQAEPELRDRWRYGNANESAESIEGYQPLFERLFEQVYDLPTCRLGTYFDEVQIQHVPSYGYGEKIAVLTELGGDRLSLTRSYENFTEWLVHPGGPWRDRLQEEDPAQTRVQKKIKAAEKAFASFTVEEQAVARRVFTSLVRVANPDEGSDDARKRVSLNNLDPAAQSVAKTLAATEVVVLRPAGENTGEEVVELADEVLLQAWIRLKNWIEEDRDFLLWRQRLETTRAAWERGEAPLLQGPRLAEAQHQLAKRPADLTHAARNFIVRSAERHGRERPEKPILKEVWEQFATYDTNAVREQIKFNRVQLGILFVGVLTVLLVLVLTQLFGVDTPDTFFPLYVTLRWSILLAPILMFFLIAISNRIKLGNKWIMLRSGAESLKREMFRYRAQAGIYSDEATQDKTREQKLADKLTQIRRQVMKTAVSEASLKPHGQTMPPDMGFLTANQYISIRLGEQLSYYSGRTGRLELRLKILHWMIYIIGGLGIVLAVIGFELWIALTTTLVLVFYLYLEYTRTETTLVLYNQVVTDLGNILTWWASLRPDEQALPSNHHLLVQQTEQALETEHSSWVQNMTEALAELQEQQAVMVAQVKAQVEQVRQETVAHDADLPASDPGI